MIVGMITCWYKDLSQANYSYNLCSALSKYVNLKVISSHCACWRYFVGRKNVFQDKCELVSFPPYIRAFDLKGMRKTFCLLYYLINLPLQFLRGICYLAKCKDVDLIHYQQTAAHPFGMVPLFVILLIPTKKKRVVTVHRPGILTKFLSRLYKRADRVIVHSVDMKKTLMSFGVPESKIEIVLHGAVLPPLLKLERKEITFFGAPTNAKGFEIVLKALKILRNLGHELKLNVYGIYNEYEKNRAINEAKDIGILDMIFFGGYLSDEEFDRKMQQSIFTVVPYLYYVSGSNLVTRAMGNATPVIASNIGGIPEYLKDCGLLIPKGDSVALADAMMKLLDDASLRQKLSENARRRAEEFSWEKIAGLTLNIYHECYLQKNDK